MTNAAPAARICCLDLDTFFVSVERLFDPTLCGKPVVVGGTPGRRGVVTACSYEVRAFGVHSGMSISEAVRLAPHAVFLPGSFGKYSPYSRQVQDILERYSPDVRPASIDEFYLDFHGCERLYAAPGDASADATIERVVREMRAQIQIELGLPASAGIGGTRTVAKIGSGRAKPAGVVMVPVGAERAFIAPLPVRRFPGIGPVAETRLDESGIRTLGELIALPPGPLRARFGGLASAVLRGIDSHRTADIGTHRPAFHEHDPHGATRGSISNERTFRADIGDDQTVRDQLRALTERLAWRARKRDIRARTITLKLRYADFHTLSRSRSLPPTHCEAEIFGAVLQLYREAHTRSLGIRLVGVQLSKLVGPDQQLGLPLGLARSPPVGSAVDAVRERFGYDAIRLGTAGKPSSWQA